MECKTDVNNSYSHLYILECHIDYTLYHWVKKIEEETKLLKLKLKREKEIQYKNQNQNANQNFKQKIFDIKPQQNKK